MVSYITAGGNAAVFDDLFGKKSLLIMHNDI